MSFDGWQLKELGDVATFSQGKQVPIKLQSEKHSEGLVRFLRIVDYTNEDEPERYVQNYGDKYIVNEKDLVMIRYGSKTAGKVVRGHSGIIANNMFKINLGNEIDIDFGYYLLSSNQIYDLLNSFQSSSTMPAISFGMLKQIKIMIPPLCEQKAIASVLSVLDDKIKLNKQISKKLEEMAQMIFRSWFVCFEPFKDGEFEESELGLIPKGWRVESLDSVADFLNGLAMQKYRPEGEEYIPVIKIKELNQGRTDRDSDKASPNIPKEYIVNDGDVIFSWSGTLEAKIWVGGVGGLNQHLFKVTSTKYNRWFYYLWIKQHMENFRQIASDKATTMGHIQRKHLTQAKVLVPEDVALANMNGVMIPIFDEIVNFGIQTRVLSLIRDILLPKLMSGEIRVPVGK